MLHLTLSTYIATMLTLALMWLLAFHQACDALVDYLVECSHDGDGWYVATYVVVGILGSKGMVAMR